MGTGFRRTLRRLLGVNIALTVVGVGLVLTFGGTLLGLLVDPRVITGAPAWLKPAKGSSGNNLSSCSTHLRGGMPITDVHLDRLFLDGS